MAETKTLSDYEEATKCLRTCTTDLIDMREMMTRLQIEGRLDMLFVMMDSFLRRGGIQEHELEKISVIHIAGTKGKGSTSAFTESILRHHGYRTGLFTSPHMYQIRERICINGRPISEEKFCHYFWQVFHNFESTVFEGSIEEGGAMPGFFDLLTVMAIRVFISEGVDVIVLEVGKGGYTDRTNFVKKPVVCGITSLALEHTESLGDTIEKIAWHKAGIIKSGRPVITFPQDPKALKVILDIARQKGAPVYIAQPLPQSLMEEYCFTLGIKGPIQVHNAGLAVQLFRAWETWKGVNKPELVNGFTKVTCIDDIPRLQCGALEINVIKGLSSCQLHGRTETIRREGVTYYLDFAHTQDSMEHCTTWFKQASKEEAATLNGKVARVLVFYCLSVKDPKKLLPILKAANFDAAAFCWSRASDSEPLGQHSDQLHSKIEPEIEDELISKMKSVWDSLSFHSKPLNGDSDFGHHLYRSYSKSNGFVSAPLKQDILENFESTNENDLRHRTNGNGLYPLDKNILANGDGVHIESVEQGEFLTSLHHPGELDIQTIASDYGVYCPKPDAEHNHSLPNGKTEVCQESPCATFQCALQALVWATQGKDTGVASSMTASRDCLPPAPSSLREADHIQVLVSGASKLVGVVLSALLPNMND